jgi:hypothetical protein
MILKNGIVLTVNERRLILMPDWFRDLFFIFLGFLVICGAILAVIIMVSVVRSIFESWKGRGS